MNIIILGVVVYLVICLIIHYNGRIVNLQTELLKKDIDILRRSVAIIEEKAETLKRFSELKRFIKEQKDKIYIMEQDLVKYEKKIEGVRKTNSGLNKIIKSQVKENDSLFKRNIDMSNTLKTYQEENAKRISRDLKRKKI